LEIKNKNSGEAGGVPPLASPRIKRVLPQMQGVEGGVTPLAVSMDQKSATANSATVMPIKYERAMSLPIFIILLLIRASPLAIPDL
jgi:hypothetical protein